MKKIKNVFGTLIAMVCSTLCLWACQQDKAFTSGVKSQGREKMLTGRYEPTWESLSQYGKAPEWFRDAKFGIWAHWGPQCVPEAGDWYARLMYMEKENAYAYHNLHYGHPSQFGFKDIIPLWKGERWDPEALIRKFKEVGARYFVAMANHHDNFDLWNSKYHRWNSVNLGPKKDILEGWSKAARNNGLYFGVSVHAAHAWMFYEPAQGCDSQGPMAGVPYDGKLTAADGKGTWWEGYDPQELYAQNHPVAEVYSWEWGDKVSVPDVNYCQDFFDRHVDMINRYDPDLLYFDDTEPPLWPISVQGLRIAAHFYNKSIRDHGENQAVLTGKKLSEEHKDALVCDIERGVTNAIESHPWQTCTCLGFWHYDRWVYEQDRYKTAPTVIRMLVDIVSKNGNLLLSVPIRPDGTIDEKEELILQGIAAWMKINGEAIYGSRPWKIYGEGPSVDKGDQNQTESEEQIENSYTSEDIRFVEKNGILYAHVLAWPVDGSRVVIKSLATDSPLYEGEIGQVELLGHEGKLPFHRGSEGLEVTLPAEKPNEILPVLKIRH